MTFSTEATPSKAEVLGVAGHPVLRRQTSSPVCLLALPASVAGGLESPEWPAWGRLRLASPL